MNEVLWRDSSIYPKLGFIDARGIFPVFIFLFHWAYWTLALAVLGIGLLYFLERQRITPVVALRFLKLYILQGNKRRTRINEVIIRKNSRW